MNTLASIFDKFLSSTTFSAGLKIILSVVFIILTIPYFNPYLIKNEIPTNIAFMLSILLGVGSAICITEIIMKLLNFIGSFIQKKYQTLSEKAEIKAQENEINKKLQATFKETIAHLSQMQINYLDAFSKGSLIIDDNLISDDQRDAIVYLDVNNFIFSSSSISHSKNIYCLQPSLKTILDEYIFKTKSANVDEFLKNKNDLNKKIISFFSSPKDNGDFEINEALFSQPNTINILFKYFLSNRVVIMGFFDGYKNIFEEKLRTKLLNEIKFKIVK